MTQVFISYSRKDLDFVEQLASDLSEAGLDVWYDLSDLEGGDRWAKELQAAIKASDVYLLVISPNSMASVWVEKEFLYASSRGKKIVPILLEQTELPLWLIDIHFINVKGRNYKRNFPYILNALGVVETPREEDKQPGKVAKQPFDWGKLKPFGLVAGLGAVLIVLALWLLPKAFQNPPLEASETPTRNPATETLTNTPAPPSETAQPDVTLTEAYTPTLTPIPSPYPEEIVDGNEVAMRFVPAGKFTMGSNIFEEEAPIHRVYLDDYYIDKFEVTNALYQACEEAGICEPPRGTFSTLHADYYSAPDFDDYPVIFVDWDMAATYCEEWRGAQLPTEAQWEKAARGPDERKYPWGATVDCFHANFWAAGASSCVGDTTTVGSYEVGISTYGVYDMAGNVWEWVNDSYNAIYYGSLPEGYENPTGPVRNMNSIVIRGGGWDSGVNGVRAAYRGYQSHTYYANNLGFRCARDVTP